MRQTIMAILTIILAIALTTIGMTPTATARDIFVSNTDGDNAADGRMAQPDNPAHGPVKTIDRALRISGPSDRIVLINTGIPYRDSISLVGENCSGTKDQPFTIVGNGITFDGTKPVPKNAWKFYQDDIFRFQPPRAGFQCLYQEGKPVSQVVATGNELPRLDPGQWCLFGPYIYFRVEKDRLPADYDLAYAQLSTGITLMYVENVVIQDVTVQGFRLDGISAVNNAHGVQLLRVVARGNGRAGISVGNVSAAVIKDSLVGDNGKAQILTLPRSETQVIDTQILANTAPAFDRQGGKLTVEGGETVEEKVTE